MVFDGRGVQVAHAFDHIVDHRTFECPINVEFIVFQHVLGRRMGRKGGFNEKLAHASWRLTSQRASHTQFVHNGRVGLFNAHADKADQVVVHDLAHLLELDQVFSRDIQFGNVDRFDGHLDALVVAAKYTRVHVGQRGRHRTHRRRLARLGFEACFGFALSKEVD